MLHVCNLARAWLPEIVSFVFSIPHIYDQLDENRVTLDAVHTHNLNLWS